MLTFKTVKGKHVITYKGVTLEFDVLSDAWRAIFALKKR